MRFRIIKQLFRITGFVFRINGSYHPYHTEEQIRVTDGLKGQTEQRKAGTER